MTIVREKVALNSSSVNEKGIRPVSAVSASDLLAHTFPKREPILSPVFNLGSLNMIFAKRGVGKTHASLGIAHAAAIGGEFWGWTANRSFKTLFIDGEMPGEALQERLAAISCSSVKAPPEDYLRFITIDMNDGMMPDLATIGGQLSIADECEKAELIIVDNLSCMVRSGGKENDAESWIGLAEWALNLRSKGKCVIFIHHAGKNGEQRGTSKREDILDVVIELKHPSDYEPDQGARFIVNFKKARHLLGDDAKSFDAQLQTDQKGNSVWTTCDAKESIHDRIIELAEFNMKKSEIANELGIDRTAVYRHLKKKTD
jgi:AAA domain